MKYIGLFLLILGLSTQSSQAQLKDKLNPHLGFSYEFVTIATKPVAGSEIIQTVRSFYTFNIGAYYSAFHKNDIVSVGFEPNVNVGFNIVNLGNKVALDYIIQTPVYLMGRLGAHATPYNEQRFGIGLGIGGVYSIFSQQVTLQNRNKAQFFNPAAMIEATIGMRSSSVTARAHFALADVESTLKNTAGSDGQFNFSNWGIGIIYAF